MAFTEQEAAARALTDAADAREVLNGDDYPRVREAILADWKAGEKEAEVTGFFNPQPDPPGFQQDLQRVDMTTFSVGWGQLTRPALNSIAQGH